MSKRCPFQDQEQPPRQHTRSHRLSTLQPIPIERVIDQYRVSTDPRSGIVNDPNPPEGEGHDPTYILRLIKQVITVSLETPQIIATLPSLNFPD